MKILIYNAAGLQIRQNTRRNGRVEEKDQLFNDRIYNAVVELLRSGGFYESVRI